jgi:hypothetical protein
MATVFAVAFLFSCNQNDAGKNKTSSVTALAIKKKIEVRFIGEVRTRRSFAGLQFIDDEKEQDKYVAEQEKNNPTVGSYFTATDSMLIEQFERLGLIKNDEFLEAKFKPQTKPVVIFTDNAKQVYPVHFYHDTLTSSTHFKIFLSKDSIDIDTKATPLQDLDYAFLDVIPGGNKELIFLDDYYIVGGYNFDFKVYEIKFN